MQQPPNQPNQWNQQSPMPPLPMFPLPDQYQQGPSIPPPQYPKKRKLPIWAWVLIVFFALIICSGASQAILQSVKGQSSTAQTTTSVPTDNPIDTPTSTPQSIHYPPTTVVDLRGLAARGDVSAIHEFHSESVGLTGACPQPKREVTVDPSVTGQQLAEDLLAYFYTQQLDSPCGSIVFAYHHQAEANDAYTAGRIKFDVTTSDGTGNVDPNASNLTYTLTLDIGDLTGQEYVVTY